LRLQQQARYRKDMHLRHREGMMHNFVATQHFNTSRVRRNIHGRSAQGSSQPSTVHTVTL
jgi:hypothetical protein